MGEKTQPYVTGLLIDAKLVAAYGQRTDAFDSGNLVAAINSIENTDPENITSSQISALQKEIVSASRTVPSSIISELQYAGSRSFEGKSTRTVISMIFVSIALMILAAHLTQLYNRGSALASDLRVLQASESERRFGQLARQLFVAMREIADNSAANEKDEVLQEQAYFQIYDDLRELDQKLTFIQSSMRQYQIDTIYPVWGMKTIKYYYYLSLRALGMGDSEVYSFLRARDTDISYYINPPGANQAMSMKQSDAASPSHVSGGMSARSAINATVVPSAKDLPTGPAEATPQASATENDTEESASGSQSEYIDNYLCAKDQDSGDELTKKVKMLRDRMKLAGFADLSQNYYYALLYLKCYENFTFLSYNALGLDEMKARLEGIMSPYAFWILPGIYGALGALIFHLRMLLNPLMPNPDGFRIIYRVSLGALAGMILAWFWLPDTTVGSQIASVGFGLFSLAFIFGFSLDVFFAMLDRFVSLSVTAMGKVGADQAKA